MRCEQWIATSPQETLDLAPLRADPPQLILDFAPVALLARDAGWLRGLGEHLPNCSLVTASTAGEIGATRLIDEHHVITAVWLEHSTVVAVATAISDGEDSHAAGVRLGERLVDHPCAAILLFAPGVAVNGSALLEGLHDSLGRPVPVFGGLAGDGARFEGSLTGLGDQRSDRTAVAIGLCGDRIRLEQSNGTGWRGFGPARRVTRSEGNVLFELDGKPALELYRRYLGEYADQLPKSGLLFPISLLSDRHQDSGLIRTLLAVDPELGSMTFAGDVPQDGYVRLMSAPVADLVQGARAAAAGLGKADNDEPALLLMVSCVGRRLMMGDAAAEEVEEVGRIVGPGSALCGFYSNGEIGSADTGGRARLHNQTVTLARLREV